MKAIFISDVHLKGANGPGYEKCLRFLRALRGSGAPTLDPPAKCCDLLVIAGDFFDFWFERGGRIFPSFRPVIEVLAGLRREGVRICFCEGNHDFFLADYFSERLGIEVFPGDAEFALDGRRVFVSHGDTVDRENRRYLTLRRFLRSPLAYGLQRRLPLRFLWRIARSCSEMGQGISPGAQQRLSDVLYRFAVEKYREGLDAVILGHSHQAILRREMVEGRMRTFALLGDWIVHDSFLVYQGGCFAMKRFESDV